MEYVLSTDCFSCSCVVTNDWYTSNCFNIFNFTTYLNLNFPAVLCCCLLIQFLDVIHLLSKWLVWLSLFNDLVLYNLTS